MKKITSIHAREVLDSRGFPTLEVDLWMGPTILGRTIVPSGASTGEGEALELRDQDPKRYLGKGVQKAVRNVRERIAPALLGREFAMQSLLDDTLRDLDGTPNKSALGANALLGVSLSYLKACAVAQGVAPYQLIAQGVSSTGCTLPVPLMNIFNGGKHADNGLAIQEFMIVPAGFLSFSKALQAGVEIFHKLKKILNEQGLSTGVGDEGGFAPALSAEKPHEQALELILSAIGEAGYKAGEQVYLALDCAASEFCQERSTYQFEGKARSAQEMISVYRDWLDRFPILSIEDGLAEKDWEGWHELTQQLGQRCQLVGDDLFVTNSTYLKRGIEQRSANAVLIKLNQIGTVTETLETMQLARQNHYASILSHRSGESEDTSIAHFAVGTDCGQIKTGSVCRTDRVAKYNELLRIEEALANKAKFRGKQTFQRLL